MTSSDKLNQNSTEKKEKNSDSQKIKYSSPNSGMMGASAVLAAATIDEDGVPSGYILNLMKEGLLLKCCGYLIMLL